MSAKTLLAAAALAFATHAQAQALFVNAAELSQKLRERDILALSYVAGVHDTLSGVAFCPPVGTKPQVLGEVVINHASSRPVLGGSGADLVRDALAEVYPCAKTRRATH